MDQSLIMELPLLVKCEIFKRLPFRKVRLIQDSYFWLKYLQYNQIIPKPNFSHFTTAYFNNEAIESPDCLGSFVGKQLFLGIFFQFHMAKIIAKTHRFNKKQTFRIYQINSSFLSRYIILIEKNNTIMYSKSVDLNIVSWKKNTIIKACNRCKFKFSKQVHQESKARLHPFITVKKKFFNKFNQVQINKLNEDRIVLRNSNVISLIFPNRFIWSIIDSQFVLEMGTE